MQTIRLQSIGHVPAIEAGQVTAGDVLVWNFGATSKVIEVVKTTPKQIVLLLEGESGERYERRLGKARLVGFKPQPTFEEKVELIEELRRNHKSAQFIASKTERREHLENAAKKVSHFMNIQRVLSAPSAEKALTETFDVIYQFCQANKDELEPIENFANIKRVAIKPAPETRMAVRRLIDSVWTVEYMLLSDHEVKILRHSRDIDEGYTNESLLPRFKCVEDEKRHITDLELYLPTFGESASFDRGELTGRYRVTNPQYVFSYGQQAA
ncbi:hypothetical protein [Vibrio aquimaris]|uniref:Uncharacterized protein n=1 Tax=Vibrio aquimaris TaxID=2587862 RepID=A0A5P9CSJ9_9VIBR|nr:hypothetical protein [Vibrio aquimaris]QFT28807.1 hypothetical protein FIV01_20610 [Vibrio aquimaris]